MHRNTESVLTAVKEDQGRANAETCIAQADKHSQTSDSALKEGREAKSKSHHFVSRADGGHRRQRPQQERRSNHLLFYEVARSEERRVGKEDNAGGAAD